MLVAHSISGPFNGERVIADDRYGKTCENCGTFPSKDDLLMKNVDAHQIIADVSLSADGYLMLSDAARRVMDARIANGIRWSLVSDGLSVIHAHHRVRYVTGRPTFKVLDTCDSCGNPSEMLRRSSDLAIFALPFMQKEHWVARTDKFFGDRLLQVYDIVVSGALLEDLQEAGLSGIEVRQVDILGN